MSETETTPGRGGRQRAALLLGIVAAVLYGGVLYLLTNVLHPYSGMAVVAFLLGAPLACSVLASIIADPRGLWPASGHFLMGVVVVTLMIISSALVFGEGLICIVMAAPLLYASSILGSAIAMTLLRVGKGGRFSSLVVLLPLLGLPLETQATWPRETGSVVTVMEINAPPSAVWAHTVAIPAIQPEEHRPSFSHSIADAPRPLDARVEGSGPGAVRHLRWERGVHFRENITVWEQHRRLGWTFAFAPDSIPTAIEQHIRMDGDYFRLTDGDYVLEPLPGGRTRLTLTTRYWVATPINLYCHWWAQRFFSDFHGAVLEVIRNRAEG